MADARDLSRPELDGGRDPAPAKTDGGEIQTTKA